jgi:hypothetical protein
MNFKDKIRFAIILILCFAASADTYTPELREEIS